MSYMDTYKKWCTDNYFDEDTKKELLALQGNDDSSTSRVADGRYKYSYGSFLHRSHPQTTGSKLQLAVKTILDLCIISL